MCLPAIPICRTIWFLRRTLPVSISLPIVEHTASTTCGGSAGGSADRRLPKWLKRNVPKGNANHFTDRLLDELKLTTVCEEAKCPNRMECWSQKTATFIILGE